MLFSSCKKDWFDIKSQNNLAVPNTLKDFQAILDDNSIMNSYDISLGEAGSDGHYVTDVSYNGFYFQNDKNAYSWSQVQPYQEVSDWTRAYTRIYSCNLVLEGLTTLNIISQTLNDVKGQALFQRARTFYNLSQVFAPPYSTDAPASELGIPLRLESDFNIPSKRSTLKETYEQVIKDLLIAKDLLPDLPEFKTRGSKASAYGLLARVYLSMEDYENAWKYSDLSLKIYSDLMDYNTLNKNATRPIAVFNRECIFQGLMNNAHSIIQSFMLIDIDLYNSYADKDIRRQVFFQRNLNTNTIIYKGQYTGSSVNFTGIATDELYLIRAECSARFGKTVDAMKDLNTLLVKRYEPGFVDKTAVDKDDALRKILEERKKELLLRGLRWSDLRRLNRDERFKTTITRTINGKNYTLESNSYKYTFPIPQDIIQITGIQQNKGWE